MKVILGPCRCQDCGKPLWWAVTGRSVRAWRDADGAVHDCMARKP